MANQTDQMSIHMPIYETEPIHFNTPTPGVSIDIAEIQNYIRERAEKNLHQCKTFEVSLPSSITGINDQSNQIKFNSLFQTPTLNELEILSTNPDGSPVKLNEEQLKAVKQTGEFHVNSIYFPGQQHRWRLSNLLQSGIRTANDVLFKELSWAFYMLMMYTRNRVVSDCFSFRQTLRSWKQGFVSLIDALIGLRSVYSFGIDAEVENERQKFLVTELSPHESEKEMYEAFCTQIPLLLEMMDEHHKYTRRRHTTVPPRMLPYPHQFLTPNKIDIDLRLHNRDLQQAIKSTISYLIAGSTPKNWFNTTKRRLINRYKNEQSALGLTKNEIAKRVQTELNNEYAERIFTMVENSSELEKLSPGLGHLLVQHARSILTMKSVVQQLNEDLENYLKMTKENLIRQHPIKSKIQRWLLQKLFDERINYILQHEWDAHQLSIEQCKSLGYDQAAYFIQRDLIFRKDHESVLRLHLKSPTEPLNTIKCHRSIWFPRNYIVERTYPSPLERVPTLFANHHYTVEQEENRRRLINSDPDAQYSLRRKTIYTTTTRYPFWRWKLFALRTFCWLSNAIFMFCIVVPLASPISFRAFLSRKPFYPSYVLNPDDLKLHKDPSSKTQTFMSRLTALWNHVRSSREKFERTPDRGFLGKNVQRIFNRLWNYVFKGFIGTVAICAIYPATCVILSTLSFILGVLSPIWLPIGTLLFHILEILIYDSNSAGEYGRKIFCLINIVVNDFLICGIIQPILVIIALVASPIVSLLLCIYALLHRCTRGAYDQLMYHLIIKRFARVPEHNSFLARRIAGPGLAAEYFYQVSSPEVLAALESLIEQKELELYGTYIEQILTKPVEEYQRFFNEAFQPFSAKIQKNDNQSVYGQMNHVVDKHIKDLRHAIDRRKNLLRLNRSSNHDRIRLTEADLTTVLMEGTQLVEKWYPTRILSYLDKDEIDKFWNKYDLDENDWLGLTSKLLQDLFCRAFLTPLEQTDVFYSLHVDHLTLSKYAQMIHTADLHDDLDVVTSVYLPETSYTIDHPSLREEVFDPNARILNISTNYTATYHKEKHGRFYRFLNRQGNYFQRVNNASKFVDYTSITCHFSIPIQLPEVIYTNVIIFNRDNNNSITTTSIKNITLHQLLQLIEYNKKFHEEPMLPIYSKHISSPTPTNDTTPDDLIMINNTSDSNNDEISNNNFAVLDEKLL